MKQPASTAVKIVLAALAVATSSPGLLAGIPEVALVAPLDRNQNVAHSWVGGFSLTHGDFGPVYLAPLFANMEPGNASWIAYPGSELQEVPADKGLAAKTTVNWSDTSVDFEMTVTAIENGVEVAGAWTASGPATGVVQLDLRIPPHVAHSITIEADGVLLWSSDTSANQQRRSFSTIEIKDAADSRLLATITPVGEAAAHVFPMPQRDGDLNSIILMIYLPWEGKEPALNESGTLAWTLTFPK